MTLRLYSSLGREVREFQPIDPGKVSMYVCGVTPYDVTHLGHAFSYVQFDTLRRYLLSKGLNVRYVQNVTDIDDDMIMVSKREGGRPIAEIRDENDAIFRKDLDRLNVLRPSAYPFAMTTSRRSSRHAKLIEKGHAYQVDAMCSSRRQRSALRAAQRHVARGPGQARKTRNPSARTRSAATWISLWRKSILAPELGARGAGSRAGVSNVQRCP